MQQKNSLSSKLNQSNQTKTQFTVDHDSKTYNNKFTHDRHPIDRTVGVTRCISRHSQPLAARAGRCPPRVGPRDPPANCIVTPHFLSIQRVEYILCRTWKSRRWNIIWHVITVSFDWTSCLSFMGKITWVWLVTKVANWLLWIYVFHVVYFSFSTCQYCKFLK